MDSSRRNMMVGSLGAVAGTVLATTGAAAQTPSTLPTATSKPALGGAYVAGSAEKKLDIINLYDLEKEAERLIPAPQFSYIRSGSGDEWTLRENVRSFDDHPIMPRYLAGVKQPDTRTSLLGTPVSMPIFVPPMAAHGLAHSTAERGTSKGAADAGTLFTAQTLANVPLSDMAKGPKWFQLYFAKDMGVNRELIARAKAIGATAIVFTVDLEWSGNRESDRRLGFKFPDSLTFPNMPNAPAGATLSELFTLFKRDLDFKDLDFIAKESGLPVVIKGIQSPENAREMVRAGAAAIQVSNHGGRQLDTVPGSFTTLRGVVDAVGDKVPVYLDGGVRRGVHVFKALAMGASGVAVGRPVLYGLSLGGAAGVTSVLNTLKTELELAMKLAGTATIKDINRKFIV